MNTSIYLDHAAATPMSESVLLAMQPFFSKQFYNPSATYLVAREVKHALQEAHENVARVIGARPSEIIFTSGGTEANNLAIRGVMEQFPEGEVIVGSTEHDSILRPAERFTYAPLSVDAQGVVRLSELEAMITDRTVLISVHYANNEVGTIQPMKEVVRVADIVRRQRRKSGNKLPLYVHTDACQAGNYLDINVARLGVDMMTLNGGKIYGPKQSGTLYVGAHVRLTPQIVGGGQEWGYRSGTENVAFAVGMATALTEAQGHRQQATRDMQELQKYFIEQLEARIPSVIVNGSRKHRLPNNVHITLPGQDNERLIFALDDRGIMAAAGSACSASSEEPSHVLRAMGVSDADAQASLRLTMGRATTKADIHYTVQSLADILA